ncbi:MAG: hypothetical protein ABJO29_00100 [Yoonia sp.]|uniref:hypothetical protein n=1 Tax=Yoonia sp. TaxID=2212373 RepID=UPI00220208BF|nr:hypothetical protein K3729_18830 [Rhodobacteraceae bacterium S2214]
MSEGKHPKRDAVIAHHIDENLKEVFADYASGDMPTEIVDLLTVLKAQDQERNSK